MPNMKTINKHTKIPLIKITTLIIRNALQKQEQWSLYNECHTEATIYQASVEFDNNNRTYTGSCDTISD